jgi:radical SAM superfamily enzyme YgiQ (UPF0313 family)
MGIKIALVTGPEESIGIKYLSAILKANGHHADLFFDPQLFNDDVISIPLLCKIFDLRENLVDSILDYNPGLIGFSVHSDFYGWASDLAARIKRRVDTPIIFGGIHPTSAPEEVIRSEVVDMVCIGEGEYPLLELADSMDNKTEQLDIKNIWFKKNGRLIRNPLRQLIDINELPYPDHDIYYRKNDYFKIGYHTMASRGCLYRCSYCCHSVLKPLYPQGGYYRVRLPHNLIGEIRQNIKRYNFRIIRFYDDLFPYDMEWLKEFSDIYKKQVDVPFICYFHPELVTEDRISILKNAGCSEIRLGIQTMNAAIRKNVLHRHETNETIERALNIIKKHKIKLVTENIVGIPGQTREDIVSMLEFYRKNRPTRNHFFWLRYYPALEITKYKNDAEEKTERGLNVQSKTFTQGGDTYNKVEPSLILALYGISWFPAWFARLFIKNHVLRCLPRISLSLLNILANLTSRSCSDRIGRLRTFRRYRFYLVNFFVKNHKIHQNV